MYLLRRGPRGALSAWHPGRLGYDQALILARLAGVPGFRYIALSRPGYLGTPLSLGRTPEEQADLYRDLLDALGLERAAVMAVSGGGPSALQFALRHPERCWGLVIISSVCMRNEKRLPMAWYIMKLAACFSPLVKQMKRKAEQDPDGASRRTISDPVMRARSLADPEAGPLLRAMQLSTYDRMLLRIPGTEHDVNLTRTGFSFDLERIQAPTLIVHGTSDTMAPFAQAQRMAARIPGAELLALDRGEHFGIFTHLEEFRAGVTRFLGAHSSPPPPYRPR